MTVSTPHPPADAQPASASRVALACARVARWWRRHRAPQALSGRSVTAVLDMFEEHPYVGEITPDGVYVHHSSGPAIARFAGAPLPRGAAGGELWESLIEPEDRHDYDQLNFALLRGEDAQARYRLNGLDGVTRIMLDRARPMRRADGSVLIRGIVSDVTGQAEADARAAEAGARFTSLLDVVGAHVYLALARPDGTFQELFQGPGADRLLGGAEPDAEMTNWEAAIHPEDRAAYDAFNARLCSGEAAEAEYRLIGADGITRWVHDRAAPRPADGGAYEVSGIVSDVSQRRRLEDELRRSMADMQRAHRELDVAHRAAERQARTDELTGVYNRRHFAQAAAAAVRTPGNGCGLLLIDADHFKPVNDVHGHAVGDAVLIELAQRLQAQIGGGDLLARWGGEEFAILLHDIDSDAELHRRAEHLREVVSATAMLTAGPLIRLTVSIGATRRGNEPAVLDELLESCDRALYAAKGLGRDRVCMAEDLAHSAPVREPESITLARGVAFAAGLRGGHLDAHSEQVAVLSQLIAEHLDLADGVVMRCRLGGLLHDVGKVAIPDAILHKPGPLTSDEWALMRTHPASSEAIVHGFELLRDAENAVRHHHERFDGTGYPDGLARQGIPIEARVIAVADAFHAMTSERVYSPAMTYADAADELRRSAGTHLDPVVVRALIEAIGLPAADAPPLRDAA